MRILISAGEASGEMYGAQLMEALRAEVSTRGASLRRTGEDARCHMASAPSDRDTLRQIEFFGVGGDKMRAAGCDIVVDAKDLSVVGITEILSHLPKIWGLFHKLIAEADRRRPDLAIVIDSPAFNWRVARQMKRRDIPVVYYVCPQFWAWRQGRVRLLRKYVDKALVIFPFEEKFYRDRGVDTQFVGHPLAGLARPAITREQYAAENGLLAAKRWITLMPGSRSKEVKMNLPGMLEAAKLLDTDFDVLIPVAPTVPKSLILDLVKQSECDGSSIHLVAEALPALAHSRAGIIASGTATVEAALMELPFVMVYRVTPLTYLLGRWTVKIPHFAMVNLIAGEEIVPELVQHDFTPERVTSELKQLIPDSPKRVKMLEGLRRVKERLAQKQGPEGNPAQRAAKVILELGAVRTLSRNS